MQIYISLYSVGLRSTIECRSTSIMPITLEGIVFVNNSKEVGAQDTRRITIMMGQQCQQCHQ